MAEELNISHLEFPRNLALLSRRVKESKPGGVIKVLHKPDEGRIIKEWCDETGNLFKPLSPTLSEVQRGKGFHGVCLNEKLSFYLTGAKLHLKEYLLKFFGKYPPYLFNFISIRCALRGMETLKREGFEFTVLPSPKEVEGYCGFAVGFKDLKTCTEAFNRLLENKIGVEVIFKPSGGRFEIIKTAWGD
jgi:hypothetical protein